MKSVLMLVGFALVLNACAHGGHTRGSVVFTDSPKEGHVCMGENEVKIGDPVKFYEVSCQPTFKHVTRVGPSTGMSCVKTPVGHGKVVGITDEHFSRVESEGELKISRGMVVEKDESL